MFLLTLKNSNILVNIHQANIQTIYNVFRTNYVFIKTSQRVIFHDCLNFKKILKTRKIYYFFSTDVCLLVLKILL